MKLKSLYINGFGKFHDLHLVDFNSRMMILLGPNEAGKSTIMHFIRRILFGFPDKRTSANLYPPLDGGKHGGSLTFERPDGHYMIERYAEEKNSLKIVYPDGSHQPVPNAVPLVGSVTSDVFNNIFAFGLDELQNFESLNNESIKDQLYSAGKGLGHISLRDFQKSLDKKIGELYKDKGSHPEINKLFRSITDISRKLHDIESENIRYKELQNELETVNQDIEAKENEKKQFMQQEHHTNSLIETWNDFRSFQETKEQLAKTPIIEKFPENGLVLMEKELEKLETLEAGIRYKQDQLDRTKRAMDGLTIQEALLENQEIILELQKRQEQYAQALEDLPLINIQKEGETTELNRLLREIGSNWNAENFEQIDNTLPNKEKVRNFMKQFESLQLTWQKKQQEKELITKELSNITRDYAENDAFMQNILPDFVSVEEAMEQRKVLSYLEEMLSNEEEKKKEITILLEKEAMQNQIKSLHRPSSNMHFSIQLFFYCMLAVILGGSIYSIVSNNIVLAWFLGSIYLPIIFLFLGYHRQKDANVDKKDTETGEDYYASRIVSLDEALSSIQADIGQTLHWMGLQSVPTKTGLIARREMIQDNLAKLNKKQEIQATMRKLQIMIESKESELKNLIEEMVHIEEAIKQNTDAWTSFLEKNRLDLELTPASVLEVFNILDTAMEKKKSIQGLQNRIQAMEETVQRFQNRMSQLLQAIGQDRDKNDWIPALESIISALHDSSKNEADLKTKQAEEKTIIDELQHMNNDLKKVRDSIQALLDQGSASDEQTFKANGEAYHRRNTLLQLQTQNSNHIKRISGEGEKYDLFMAELQNSSNESLIRTKDDLEEVLKECENTIRDLREHKGRINKEIEQIEKKEESSALRLEKSVNVEKVNILGREWAALVLAKSIMKKAIEEYEREKQPNVIKESQHYFSLMTLGAYPSIYSPLNEDVLYVEGRNKIRKDIKDLSKGTAEQLYLSLRFGFIQEFTKNNEPLPIIMDDILVNFDPTRFEACCEALHTLSSDHQILYFTCHPDSAEKMSRLIRESTILTLPCTKN